MIDDLTKTEKLSGDLFVDGEELGECRYELKYDPYATNKMRVELLDPPGISYTYPLGDFRLVTDFPWGCYTCTGKVSGASNDMKGSKVTGRVEELRMEQWFAKKSDASTLSVSYLFPLTSITEDNSPTVRHARYGFVRGSYDKQKNVFTPHGQKPIVVSSGIGDFRLSEEFDHQVGPSALYAQDVLIRRSVAGSKFELDESNVNDALVKAREAAARLFLVISLVERDRIGWHTERVALHSADSKPVGQIKTHQWVSPPTSRYRPNANAAHKRRATFETVCNALLVLGPEDASKIDRVIRNFIVANTSPTIETQIIHWHSCLDFFKKEHRIPKGPFSEQLVQMFDKIEIPLEDLLPPSTVAALRSDQKDLPVFDFVDLRNRYIHEGFDAFEGQYPDAIQHVRVMRALAERLLLYDLGIDFDATSLGRVGLP